MPEKTVASTQPFMVMAKPVGSRCNMQCTYCYYTATQLPKDNEKQLCMSDETLERFIMQYIDGNTNSPLYFVWHGGEPAIAGIDFFKRAIMIQKKYLPEGMSCKNNLQTNGLLLDDEWCAFLAKNDFDVGLSIDGTQLLHDHYRKDLGGNGTHARVAATVDRLQSFGIKPDLLCTVNSETVKNPLAVYRALRSFGTGWIQFIPIVRRENGSITMDSVTGEGYGNFLCAVFDEWVLNDLGKVDVQIFSETARVWAGGSAVLCWMAPVCGRVLIVELDGSVYSCDHFVKPDFHLGDVGKQSLRELVDSPFQLEFGNGKREKLTAQCRSCQWLSVCNGGCPKDRFELAEDGEYGANYLCDGLKSFFSYAQPAINLVTMLNRNRQTPEAIMVDLRNRLKAIWKDIGRNDLCPCGSSKKAKHCCWDKAQMYSR